MKKSKINEICSNDKDFDKGNEQKEFGVKLLKSAVPHTFERQKQASCFLIAQTSSEFKFEGLETKKYVKVQMLFYLNLN
jgi:hypothetical protein